MALSLPPEVSEIIVGTANLADPFTPTLNVPAVVDDGTTLMTLEKKFLVAVLDALAPVTDSTSEVYPSAANPDTTMVFPLSLPDDTSTICCGGAIQFAAASRVAPAVVVEAAIAREFALYPDVAAPSMTTASAAGMDWLSPIDVAAVTATGPALTVIGRI
jgi:hypothetical protein